MSFSFLISPQAETHKQSNTGTQDATQENRIRLDKVCGGWNKRTPFLCVSLGRKKDTTADGHFHTKKKKDVNIPQ
jgi:hypothetical protein